MPEGETFRASLHLAFLGVHAESDRAGGQLRIEIDGWSAGLAAASVGLGVGLLGLLLGRGDIGAPIAAATVAMFLVVAAMAVFLCTIGLPAGGYAVVGGVAALLALSALAVERSDDGLWVLDLLAPPIVGMFVAGVAILGQAVRQARRSRLR